MKKLCMLCNQLDENDAFTCPHCGEATWTVQELEESEESKPEAKPKKGRK